MLQKFFLLVPRRLEYINRDKEYQRQSTTLRNGSKRKAMGKSSRKSITFSFPFLPFFLLSFPLFPFSPFPFSFFLYYLFNYNIHRHSLNGWLKHLLQEEFK